VSTLYRALIVRGKIRARVSLTRPSPTDARWATCPCGGEIHRSSRTGILHRFCFQCRYLRMIYGPNIETKRITP
jgi:hypothetical protein